MTIDRSLRPEQRSFGMRVLFTSIRNTSHFLPLVPFIDSCRKRGHEVGVAAPLDLAERVAKTGATYFPFGHPGDEGLRPIWMRLRSAPETEGNSIVVREIFAGACATAALPGLLQTIERFRPSIVIRESQEYAGLIAAEKTGTPHVRVAITARTSEAKLFAQAAEPVDAHCRGLGLPPDPAGERMRREPVLTLFPASLEVLDPDAAPAMRFRTARQSASPLPDWWGTQQGPIVYVTLGTVAGGMEGMRPQYRTALEAVRELPIRVLLTVGPDLPLETLGEVPANVHIERFVPQDDVLPHVGAVLCHGGSGTVLGTLAAGVPMVVAPLFADQPGNADRIAAVGAGLAMPRGSASASDVRHALSRVLEDGSFRTAAGRIAQDIAALRPVDEAAVDLERLAGDETAGSPSALG